MGQKVNPVGFRIGVNKYWKTISCTDKKEYRIKLEEDVKIRDYIRTNLEKAGVIDIVIKRKMSKALIEIRVARPGIVIGKGGAGIERVKKDLSKMVGEGVEIKLFEVKKPESESRIVAMNVANQVKRRIMPKIAAQREIENSKNTGIIKGIRIWVSGRIKGAEIARIEKFQWGSIPLQTLRADIDYSYVFCKVPNAGIHGIKVWIYKGEKTSVEV